MLPFGRMFEYGNNKSDSYIKRIDFEHGTSFCTGILSSSGSGYIGGNNSNGELGNGNNTNMYNTLVKISVPGVFGIRDLACSITASIFITDDNRIFLSGNKAILNQSSVSVNTFEDITSYFSTVPISRIVKISISSVNCGILLDDGSCYLMGLNRYGEFGLGSTGYKTLTLVSTGVLDFSLSAENTFYVKTDRKVYAAGRNRLYFIKSSASGGVDQQNITTFTEMFPGVSGILHVNTADGACVAYTSSTAYCKGSNSVGSFGDGNSTLTNTNTLGETIQVQLSVPCIESPIMNMCQSGYASSNMYVGTNGRLYSTGNNTYKQLGVDSDTTYIGVYTEVPGIVVQENDVLHYSGQVAYIGRTGNIVYGAGRSQRSITSTPLTRKFEQININW